MIKKITSTTATPVCYHGKLAMLSFIYLLIGNDSARCYQFVQPHAFGLFFVKSIQKWIAFDNRRNTLEVDVFDSKEIAEQMLEHNNPENKKEQIN